VPAAVVATATATTATTATSVALNHECDDYASDEHHNHEPNPTGDDEGIVGFFHKIGVESHEAIARWQPAITESPLTGFRADSFSTRIASAP
jgi:hypothetical protein